jgi:hypothetical protein
MQGEFSVAGPIRKPGVTLRRAAVKEESPR